MKYFAAFIVVAIALMTGSESVAWVTYSNDFESGLGPDLAVINASGLYTVDDSNSDLRISKPEDDGTIQTTGNITAGVLANFHLVGDFTVTVDFSLNDLPIAPGIGINESILRCFKAPTDSEDYDRPADDDEFSMLHLTLSGWAQYAYGAWPSGHYKTSPATQGRYRIVRNGSNMAAYFAEGAGDFSLVWQSSQFTDDVQIALMGIQGKNYPGNPRSTTAMDISFDNLDVIAEDIFFILPGDANLDGSVNVSDLGILAGYYGISGDQGWDHGDFNYDKNVDINDLGILASHYGEGTSPGAPVPEPSSIVLLGIGVAVVLVVRRKQLGQV